MVQFTSIPRQPRVLGTRRRARVHSVFSFQSDGRGKFSYSAPGYSLKGLWACSTPQVAKAVGTNQKATRQRISALKFASGYHSKMVVRHIPSLQNGATWYILEIRRTERRSVWITRNQRRT